MGHDNHLGLPDPLDHAPRGVETLLDTLFVALAAIVGITAATIVAVLVAPLGAGVGLLALFVGWPVGFVAATVGLRAGVDAIANSGLLASLRTLGFRGRAALRRVRTGAPAVTDGAGTYDSDATCECQ
ncbi:hypothetical protein ACH9L7_00425 [Haloferax sp. S1W]|uniref:hypothetical protein n=1 Tax=Haloferax sp. S1W TaxID=3377110 RepID=UPI0037C6CD23